MPKEETEAIKKGPNRNMRNRILKKEREGGNSTKNEQKDNIEDIEPINVEKKKNKEICPNTYWIFG